MQTSDYELVLPYIDGAWADHGRGPRQPIVNPATGEVLAELHHAQPEDIDRALRSADLAFSVWRDTSPLVRSELLRRVAALARERSALIAWRLTLDQGKPLHEATREVLSAADHADWHAEECRRLYGRVIPSRSPNVRQLVLRQPVGVCAGFTPWNFPFTQAMRKVCAALGAGCTIVLKGPEDAPSAVAELARLFSDAGAPAGCLNVVWGVPFQVAEQLITSPVVRKVSFTGSVAVGKQLAALAGKHMKRCTMELGGHSPVLVFDDAEIDKAALALAEGKAVNAGQVCVSPTRFFVQRGSYERFLDRFVGALSALKVGNGLDEGVKMGPLCHERRIAAMQEFVADAVRQGGQIVTGGSRLDRPGHFFEPTVVAKLPATARLMNEEPFGPIASVHSFDDADEAIHRANSLPYGLASYAFTSSSRTASRIARELAFGMVNINHFGSGLPETPFGGIKDSGYGSEGGSETFDGYLTTKFVTQLD